MYCDYPLDTDSTLEINLTKHLKISTLFNQFKRSLLIKMDFEITTKHQ